MKYSPFLRNESHKCPICLQLLLRKKAAEELKKEQERKAAERRRIIEERCGKPKNVDDANEGTFASRYEILRETAESRLYSNKVISHSRNKAKFIVYFSLNIIDRIPT